MAGKMDTVMCWHKASTASWHAKFRYVECFHIKLDRARKVVRGLQALKINRLLWGHCGKPVENNAPYEAWKQKWQDSKKEGRQMVKPVPWRGEGNSTLLQAISRTAQLIISIFSSSGAPGEAGGVAHKTPYEPPAKVEDHLPAVDSTSLIPMA